MISFLIKIEINCLDFYCTHLWGIIDKSIVHVKYMCKSIVFIYIQFKLPYVYSYTTVFIFYFELLSIATLTYR